MPNKETDNTEQVQEEMPKPFKLWIEALRSGEYKQGTNQLETNKGLCCLGVACRVAEKEGVTVYLDSMYGRRLDGESLEEQPATFRWLGLKNKAGLFGNPTVTSIPTHLTELNDGSFKHSPKSFPEIADFIETNWKLLIK